MRDVSISDAKAHLTQLLDDVERGETIGLTRRGRRIARLVPEAERRQREIEEALDNLTALGREIRKRNPDITIEEILSSIHEGHKY